MRHSSRSSHSPRRAAAPAARRVAARPAKRASRVLPPPGLGPGPGLADKVPLLLFTFDVERHRLLHCNRHCYTVLGHHGPELVALGPRLLESLFHPASRAQLLQADFARRLAAGREASWDCRLRHRDGSWRWLRIRARATAVGPRGQVRALTGSAEDVTRHRAAVEGLRQSRHLMRRVGNLVPNFIYIYSLREKRNIYANHRVEAALGYTGAELAAFAPDELLPHFLGPEALAQYQAHLAELDRLPDGETLTMEFAVRHRDGSPRWQRITHACFARDGAGRLAEAIGVVEDVTPQRADAEQQRASAARLAEQHRLLRQIIDALPHPIYLKDGHGNYLLANEALAALYGRRPDELTHGGDAALPPGSDFERFRAQDQQVLATGEDLTVEESYTQPDGTVLWFSSVKRRFARADGQAQVLGVDSNITELKRTQQALEAAIAAAEANAEAKQNFLANMSHEIRTPLHGILGLTGVLAKTTLGRSQHDYLRLLAESADHLLAVLNDVLTTARLGAGKLRPESSALAVGDVLRGCAALLRPRAREKGLRLRLEKSGDLPAVLGDGHRLRQVLLNLVSNAIKFTETGQVRLGCRRVPAPAGPPAPAGTVWLRFTVADTGVGIAAEALDAVFEPFTQATASTDREYGGSGLGLSISAGLVQLLGGVLRVSSAVGVGSTFAFVLAFAPLPTAAAAPEPAPAAPAPAPATGRVLLVEDNPVNSLLAETVLRNWGWQVTTAASGPAAIQLFDHRAFDLVLMDIQMPGMDGETAARALRQHPDPVRAATPVVALTARAQPGEAERLRAAGFAGYLTKPYREEQLLETMHTALAAAGAPPAASAPNAPLMPLTSLAKMPFHDLTNVRQLVRHDEAIVRRLAWAFIETTPAILAALDETLIAADWEGVGDAAHHLKSSLDGLGVESLRHVIRELENYGTARPDPAHAAQQVALVRATTEQVMADLRAEFPE